MRIYHYTNIETLALILKNKTIRFNRLDHVDDLEEARCESSGIKIGQYLFVSCWTEDSEESIPLWRMYTEKGVGVRIGLEKEMFKKYTYRYGEVISGVTINGKGQTLLSPKMLQRTDVCLIPCFNDGVFYRNVQYVPSVAEAMKNAVAKNNNELTSLNLSEWGAYKNLRWKFQKESRFVLNIYPKPQNIPYGSDLLAPYIYYVINKGIPNDIDYYDMDLDKFALNSIDITLCPNMSDGNKIIVESLCKANKIKANIRESVLTDMVNFK